MSVEDESGELDDVSGFINEVTRYQEQSTGNGDNAAPACVYVCERYGLEEDVDAPFQQDDEDDDQEDDLQDKIAKHHAEFLAQQAARREQVRAAAPWSAPPLMSPRPETQRQKKVEALELSTPATPVGKGLSLQNIQEDASYNDQAHSTATSSLAADGTVGGSEDSRDASCASSPQLGPLPVTPHLQREASAASDSSMQPSPSEAGEEESNAEQEEAGGEESNAEQEEGEEEEEEKDQVQREEAGPAGVTQLSHDLTGSGSLPCVEGTNEEEEEGDDDADEHCKQQGRGEVLGAVLASASALASPTASLHAAVCDQPDPDECDEAASQASSHAALDLQQAPSPSATSSSALTGHPSLRDSLPGPLPDSSLEAEAQPEVDSSGPLDGSSGAWAPAGGAVGLEQGSAAAVPAAEHSDRPSTAVASEASELDRASACSSAGQAEKALVEGGLGARESEEEDGEEEEEEEEEGHGLTVAEKEDAEEEGAEELQAEQEGSGQGAGAEVEPAAAEGWEAGSEDGLGSASEQAQPGTAPSSPDPAPFTAPSPESDVSAWGPVAPVAESGEAVSGEELCVPRPLLPTEQAEADEGDSSLVVQPGLACTEPTAQPVVETELLEASVLTTENSAVTLVGDDSGLPTAAVQAEVQPDKLELDDQQEDKVAEQRVEADEQTGEGLPEQPDVASLPSEVAAAQPWQEPSQPVAEKVPSATEDEAAATEDDSDGDTAPVTAPAPDINEQKVWTEEHVEEPEEQGQGGEDQEQRDKQQSAEEDEEDDEEDSPTLPDLPAVSPTEPVMLPLHDSPAEGSAPAPDAESAAGAAVGSEPGTQDSDEARAVQPQHSDPALTTCQPTAAPQPSCPAQPSDQQPPMDSSAAPPQESSGAQLGISLGAVQEGGLAPEEGPGEAVLPAAADSDSEQASPEGGAGSLDGSPAAQASSSTVASTTPTDYGDLPHPHQFALQLLARDTSRLPDSEARAQPSLSLTSTTFATTSPLPPRRLSRHSGGGGMAAAVGLRAPSPSHAKNSAQHASPPSAHSLPPLPPPLGMASRRSSGSPEQPLLQPLAPALGSNPGATTKVLGHPPLASRRPGSAPSARLNNPYANSLARPGHPSLQPSPATTAVLAATTATFPYAQLPHPSASRPRPPLEGSEGEEGGELDALGLALLSARLARQQGRPGATRAGSEGDVEELLGLAAPPPPVPAWQPLGSREVGLGGALGGGAGGSPGMAWGGRLQGVAEEEEARAGLWAPAAAPPPSSWSDWAAREAWQPEGYGAGQAGGRQGLRQARPSTAPLTRSQRPLSAQAAAGVAGWPASAQYGAEFSSSPYHPSGTTDWPALPPAAAPPATWGGRRRPASAQVRPKPPPHALTSPDWLLARPNARPRSPSPPGGPAPHTPGQVTTAAVDVGGVSVSVYVAEASKKIREANRCMAALGMRNRFRLQTSGPALLVQVYDGTWGQARVGGMEGGQPAPLGGWVGEEAPGQQPTALALAAAAPALQQLTLQRFLAKHARLKAQAGLLATGGVRRAPLPILPGGEQGRAGGAAAAAARGMGGRGAPEPGGGARPQARQRPHSAAPAWASRTYGQPRVFAEGLGAGGGAALEAESRGMVSGLRPLGQPLGEQQPGGPGPRGGVEYVGAGQGAAGAGFAPGSDLAARRVRSAGGGHPKAVAAWVMQQGRDEEERQAPWYGPEAALVRQQLGASAATCQQLASTVNSMCWEQMAAQARKSMRGVLLLRSRSRNPANALATAFRDMTSSTSTSEQSHHVKSPGLLGPRFKNPWEQWEDRGFSHVWQWQKERRKKKLPFMGWLSGQRHPSAADWAAAFPACPVDWQAVHQPPDDAIQATWVGHASVLVQMAGFTFLTDPVMSARCAPVQWAGPQRVVPAAFQVRALLMVSAADGGVPEQVKDPQFTALDFVLISHNHYDHLDADTVDALNAKFGAGLTWYVPLGLAAWFAGRGVRGKVVELDWWQQVQHQGKAGQHSSVHCVAAGPGPALPQQLQVTLTPAMHWSARGVLDRCRTLWGSWAVASQQPRLSFWFAGDTGYCPVFKEVRQRCGPFDLAAIPIGAYEPRWFSWLLSLQNALDTRYAVRPQHVNAEEGLAIHRDVGARVSLAIHCCTWALTDEALDEPPRSVPDARCGRNGQHSQRPEDRAQVGKITVAGRGLSEVLVTPPARRRLHEALEESGCRRDEFVTVRHGEKVVVRDGRLANKPLLISPAAEPVA
ncbi:hypothetical protein QJQ45_013792 [Haematococcus lacustris]|nr:hypothetical protein QJQ45_013792 [Haematococcus lacustris]